MDALGFHSSSPKNGESTVMAPLIWLVLMANTLPCNETSVLDDGKDTDEVSKDDILMLVSIEHCHVGRAL